MIATAARLPGIAAVVSQCPFTDGIDSARTFGSIDHCAYHCPGRARLRGCRARAAAGHDADRRPPWRGRVDECSRRVPGFLRLVPDGMQVVNEVAARFGMKVFTYHPGRLAAKIPCPTLFCVCEADSVAPAGATLRHAAKAPRGEIKLYQEGHFDIYVDDAFECAVTDQLALLDKHLKAATG